MRGKKSDASAGFDVSAPLGDVRPVFRGKMFGAPFRIKAANYVAEHFVLDALSCRHFPRTVPKLWIALMSICHIEGWIPIRHNSASLA